jgi:hypothetical protein
MVFAVVAFADAEDTATIEALSDTHKGESHTYQILGTWAGVITFEAKTRGTSTWVSIMATNVADDSVAATTTANGVFRLIADGMDSRARFSTDTSGAPQVWRTQRQV